MFSGKQNLNNMCNDLKLIIKMFANKFLYSVQLFLIVLVTELKFLGPIILIINWAERGKKGHINIFYNT